MGTYQWAICMCSGSVHLHNTSSGQIKSTLNFSLTINYSNSSILMKQSNKTQLTLTLIDTSKLPYFGGKDSFRNVNKCNQNPPHSGKLINLNETSNKTQLTLTLIDTSKLPYFGGKESFRNVNKCNQMSN